MSLPAGQNDRRQPEDNGLSGLHYLMLFCAFGVVGLILISSKYQARQAHFEQQFQGAREMQAREQQPAKTSPDAKQPDAKQPDAKPIDKADPVVEAPAAGEDPPLILSLRPLIAVLSVVMLLAWAGIQRRRLRLVASRAPVVPQPPEK